MAFPDPQVITINAVAQSCPRIASGPNSGAFQKDDASVKRVSHTYNKRTRHLIRVDSSKITADPLNPTSNLPYSMSAHLVVDVPVMGYTVAEQKQVVDGFLAYLSASSGANVTRLLGGEN